MKLPYHALKAIVLIAFSLSVYACTKEKTEPPVVPPAPIVKPVIDSLSLSPDNKQLTIYFSQGVFGYSNGDELVPVSDQHLHLKLTGGQALLDSTRVAHVAGDSVAHVTLHISGVINGHEVMEVQAANDSSVMNLKHHYLVKEVKTTPLHETGIFGFWVSTGANLSPLFQQFNFDSVLMEYKADGTYTFETIKTGSIHNYLRGTYTQSKNEAYGLWIIKMYQQLPVESTMEGIFALENASPVVLTYETVQTFPVIPELTPPHPAGGFGSSGIFGEENIQTFIKVSVH